VALERDITIGESVGAVSRERRASVGRERAAASSGFGHARRWSRSERLPWIGLWSVLFGAVLLVLVAAQTDPLLPQTIRPAPGSLAPLGTHGVDLGWPGVVLINALMYFGYLLVVRGARELTPKAVLLAIGAVYALVLLAPPLLSTDVFSYIAYGRIGSVYGANPYTHGPTAIQLDQLYNYIDAQWVRTPSAYGPLFTALSYVLAPLSIAANVFAYKAIAALSSLAVVTFVWKAAQLRGINPVPAVALVGLNPLVVMWGLGGGHNDMLMLAILMGAVYVLLQERHRGGGVLVVVAAAVKLTAGVLLPFALARRDGAGSRRALVVGTLGGLAAVVVFSAALFGTGPLHLLATLQKVQTQGGLHSVSSLLLGVTGLNALRGPVSLALDVVFLAVLAELVRRVWRGRLDWIAGAGWATVALLLTAELMLPWYVAWLIPLAALARDRRLIVAVVALTALGLTTV
jgi:alpha-1,6-mannosyltransferase